MQYIFTVANQGLGCAQLRRQLSMRRRFDYAAGASDASASCSRCRFPPEYIDDTDQICH